MLSFGFNVVVRAAPKLASHTTQDLLNTASARSSRGHYYLLDGAPRASKLPPICVAA